MASGQAYKCDNCGTVDVGRTIETDRYAAPFNTGPSQWFQVIDAITGKRSDTCSAECLSAWGFKAEAESLAEKE